MKRFLLLLTIFAAINANAAWLTNIPVDATQPDGTVLNLFATGDEYHNRVHDADGYTLVRNAAGWVVYAQLDADGNLAPTNIVYGQSSNIRRARQAAAQAQGIAPNIDIAPERWMQLREEFHNRVSEYESADEVGARGPQRAPTATTRRTGTMNNIVIYISFPDAPSFSHTHSSIETLYNSTVAGASLKSYYRDISNNEFNINSTFYPLQSGSTIISFTAPNPRSYYMIDNTGTGATIEQTLMAQALTYCKPQIEAAFPDAAALDYDNNNYVDNVNFVIQGNPGAWSTLLWPHKWSLYLQNVSLRGKRVYEYNLLMENHFFSASNGKQSVLVHETYHTLSAPDLYTYNGDGASGVPVNTWDVMAQNNGTPQSSTAYITARYGHFITDDEIREITASGTYTIYDIWDRAHNASHPIAYKITSPTSTRDEYYVIEYRRKGGMLGGVYDNGIPGAGIVISRIAPNTNGNSNGKGTDANPYGVYVVRPNGTSSSGGTINDAHFSQQTGRTTFSDFSNPAAFLNNGSPGLDGIVIDQISASGGETMTFRVTFPSAGVPVATDASNVKINSFTANWNPTTNTQSYQISVYRKDGGNKVSIQNYNVGNAVSFKVEGLDYMASKIWYYTVKGVSGGTPSAESNEITVNCDEHSPAFPYQPTFATNDYWNLENGTQTNKWYTGSTNGLYISNDNGASNAYTFNTTSYVYAIRTLKLLQAGKLTVSFNWRAKGETSAYDVLRAFLVPVGINANLNDGDANGMTGTTNTIPNGWIDVGGGILWNKDTYQQATTTLDITNPDYYNLVFFWKNDAVGGTQPPASVTNLKVSFLTTPTALPATQIKYTSFQANWTAVESANQYIVTVTDTLGNPHTGSPYTANTNYITISNIVDRKKYIYTVQAVDAVGAVSDISNSISVVYSNVPAPVATVATHVEYTSFQANWNAVPNAKQYEVYIKLNGTDLLNVIANTNSYTLINITTRGTYSYTIIAVDSVNNKSVPSNEISVVYTNVSAPVATAYSDTTYTSFKANWNDTTTNASSVKHYLLTLIKDSTEIVYDSIKIEKPNTSYEFVNINKRGLYTYRVSIVDIQGNVSLPSNEISIFYPDVPAPVAAEVIPADTTYTSFTARWNAVNVNNHDVSNHFLLTVKDGNGNIFLSYDSLDVGNVNEYTVTGIEKRGSYTFSVIAVDVVDNTSVSSNEISITYPDVPAPVAYNVAAADSAYTHFTARWSAINAAKHYIITVHRGDSVIADYPKTVNTNSHTVTGITLRGSYTFNVVAEDNYGNFSAQSNPGGIFYRDVPAPAIQPATQVRYTSFQANWNALPEAAQYKLTIKKDSAELANPSQPITITQNYYLLGNIVERGVYTYSVMAIDVAGNVSPQSAEASVIYPKIATPVATDATEIQHTSFQANWNTVANVNYYLLTVKDSLNNLIRDAVNADKATSYTVNNITKRGRYTYYVVAVDSAGNRSPQSNVISIVYSDIDSPVATAATDTTTSSFTANWQNNVSVANHYIINVTKKKTVVVTETPHTTVAEWTFANNPGNMKPDAYSENNANQLLTANALGGITMVSGASSYAASATGWYLATLPEMRYWQIDVNTVGFNNLTISSKQKGYYSSPKNFKIQYRVGNGDWTDVDNGSITMPPVLPQGATDAGWTVWEQEGSTVTYLPLPEACEDKENVSIRWIMQNNSDFWNNNVIYIGQSQIDDILVEGTMYAQQYDVYTDIAGSPFGEDDRITGTSHIFSGLEADATYYYTVTAVDNVDNYSRPSNVITVNVPELAAPNALDYDSRTSSQFNAKWTGVTFATEYLLSVTKEKTITVPEIQNVIVAQWTFPAGTSNLQPDAASETNADKLLKTTGTGNITFTSAANTLAAQATNWDNGAGWKAWQIDINTTGFDNLKLSSKQRSNNGAPKNFKVQYKRPSDADWLDVKDSSISMTVYDANSSNPDYGWSVWGAAGSRIDKLNLPAECENQENLSIRWVVVDNNDLYNRPIYSDRQNQIDDIVIQGRQFYRTYNTSETIVGSPFEISAPNTEKLIDGLEADATYYYSVKAKDVAGNISKPSDTITVTRTEFPAPEALAARDVTTSSFSAYWNGVSGAHHYILNVWKERYDTIPEIENATVAQWTFPTNQSILTPDIASANNTDKLLTSTPSETIITIVSAANTYAASKEEWKDGAGNKAWQIDINTYGFAELNISSKQRSNNGAPKNFKIQYRRPNDLDWTDVAGSNLSLQNTYDSGPDYGWSIWGAAGSRIDNLTLPTGCENQENLSIRWVMVDNKNLNDGGVVNGADRVNQIDDIIIKGKQFYRIDTIKTEIKSITITDAHYSLSGLEAGVKYFYTVKAVDGSTAANESAWSDTIAVTLPKVAAPVATAATELTGVSFKANWNEVDFAEKYVLNVKKEVTIIIPELNDTLAGWTFPTGKTDFKPDIATANNVNKLLSAVNISSPAIVAPPANNNVASQVTNAASATGWRDDGAGWQYWQINVNTVGYDTLKLSSKQRSEYAAPKDFKIQYLSNTWVDVANGIIALPDPTNQGDGAFGWTVWNAVGSVVNNLLLPAECKNQENLSIRWLMTNNSSFWGSSVQNTRTSQIDDIIIKGKRNGKIYKDTTVLAPITITNGNTSYTLDNLEAGANYYYTVTAVDVAENESAASNEIAIAAPNIFIADEMANWNAPENWSHGEVPATDEWTVINGNAVITRESGLVTAENITINTDKSLTLKDGGQLTANNILNNGTLAVENNSGAETASTIITTNNITGSGNVQYKQNLSAANDRIYWYLTSPIENTPASAFLNIPEVDKLRYNDEITDAYTDVNPASNLIAGIGYQIRLTTPLPSYILTNTDFYHNNIVIPLTRQGATHSGYNLISNPYPSYLDWQQVTDNNELIYPTVWYRTMDENGTMTFDVYNCVAEVGVSHSHIEIEDGLVPPTQTFWVRVKPDNAVTSVTITDAMRQHGDENNSSLRAPANNKQIVRLNISDEISTDQTAILFNNRATNGFDDFDSEKMTASERVRISTRTDNKTLVINTMNAVSDKMIIPLGFFVSEQGNFNIYASSISNLADYSIILKDNILNQEFDLTSGNAYNFASAAVNNTSRFAIIFRTNENVTNVENQTANNFTAWSENGKIIVNSAIIDGKMLNVYNAIGQKLTEQTIVADKTVIGGAYPSGVYFVKIGNTTKKVIVK